MSYSDLEHFSNMIAGCESINEGDYKSPNSIYAQTVLKLHANDAGLYAGQEGFLDMIKKGASSVKKWFLELIKAIVNFIGEVNGQNSKRRLIERQIAEREKKLKNDIDAIQAHKTKLTEVAVECFSFPGQETKRIYDEIDSGDYFDNDLFGSLNITTFRVGGGHTAMANLAEMSKNPDNHTHEYVGKEIEHLEKAISELARESKREVSKYQDDTEIIKKTESGIRVAGLMLTKYTNVLKLWNDALNRFYKMVK